MLLYILAASGGSTDVLLCHHNDPIAGHSSTKHTFELASRKSYWPSLTCKVKAYTQACSTCWRVCPMQPRLY